MLAKRALKTLRWCRQSLVPTSPWYQQSLVPTRYSSTGHHVTNDQIRFSKHHKWNKAVSEAEALVGFPTSVDALQMIAANNGSSSMTAYMKKLMASDHPVLRTAKRMVYDERNLVQVRGLLILLLCRCLGDKISSMSDFDTETGVLRKQRKLAECIEMIFLSQALLKSVLNLPPDLHEQPDSPTKDDLLQLEFGNKIAILTGDYLLAQSCVALADLRNTYVVEIVTMAIADFTQSEFVGARDVQGRMIPAAEKYLTTESWRYRMGLAYGNTMAAGCKSAAMLADLDDEMLELFHRIGTNLALAIQSAAELQMFTHGGGSHGESFDLGAAPVLFHLQNDPELLEYINRCDNNLDNLDYGAIHRCVALGTGADMAAELCQFHTGEAIDDIDKLNDGDAKEAIFKMLNNLR